MLLTLVECVTANKRNHGSPVKGMHDSRGAHGTLSVKKTMVFLCCQQGIGHVSASRGSLGEGFGFQRPQHAIEFVLKSYGESRGGFCCQDRRDVSRDKSTSPKFERSICCCARYAKHVCR